MGNYSFSQVPTVKVPRSTFNRSHGHKTTFDSGYLVPVFVDEALPGDTFNLRASLFARLATPIVPIMDNLHLDAFFFAVPNRLLWENWQRFMGERDNPTDSTDYLVPVVEAADPGGFTVGSLFDYMGYPTGVAGLQASALFPRAYNLIYNEWFRDQNMVNAAPKNIDDGPDDAADYELKRRNKRHDYFTSCLPWPQKGDAAGLLIDETAPVIPAGDNGPTFISGSAGREAEGYLQLMTTADPGNPNYGVRHPSGNATNDPVSIKWGNTTDLMADLTNTTAVTINALREAFQIQKLLEKDARGGTRYVEILKSHFGVTSPDARLQRPEFLGGGSIPVIVNPVTQTSASGTGALNAKGSLAAYGVAAGKNVGFTKSFVEHCVIIGLVSVRADLSYQQGLPRMFSRRTRYDFYWPSFAHLGEQAVLNKEIYCIGDSDPVTGDEGVFGYQERWAEYRYHPSKITGKFRSTDSTPLDFWHLAQEFEECPTLGESFIQEDPPVARVVAVNTEPEFIFDSHFALKCTRPMPTFSVPGYIDHF